MNTFIFPKAKSIVVCGDYKKLQKRLASNNCWLVMLRGNHDNPAYFNTIPIKHRRFLTISDYSVIQACNHNILCVGGAVSVDRSYRKSSLKYHHDSVVKHHPLRYWFYGHFHQSWHCEIDNVMYRMLDIMELHEIH